MKEAYITEILRSLKEGQIYSLKRIEEVVELLREHDSKFILQETMTVDDPEKAFNNYLFIIKHPEWTVVFISRHHSNTQGLFTKCIFNHVFHQFDPKI